MIGIVDGHSATSHDKCPGGDAHGIGIWKGELPVDDNVCGMGALGVEQSEVRDMGDNGVHIPSTSILSPLATPPPVTLSTTSATLSSDSSFGLPL